MKKLIILLGLAFTMMANASDLKILTWNLFMIPKPFNNTLQQTRADMMASLLPGLGHDVYFFQEAFIGKTKKKLTNAFKNTHPYTARLGVDGKIPHLLDSGLLVFSRYPMKVLGHEYFKKCAKTDCFAAKAALLVEVTTPDGKKVQIATTHMQAWVEAKALAVRQTQLVQIKNLFKRYENPGIPQVLVGDLNIDGLLPDEYPGALDFLDMSSAPLNGRYSSTNGFVINCYRTPGEPHSGQWLDHVWIKPHQTQAAVRYRAAREFSGKFKKTGWCPLSDHRPVEALITL